MEIFFGSNRLAKACNEEREGDRLWGKQVARRVRQRLVELRAAETLADMSHLPPARCHQLKGDRAGQFAVDVSFHVRLVFEPYIVPVPRRDDGGIDLSQIRAIRIWEVEDYHG